MPNNGPFCFTDVYMGGAENVRRGSADSLLTALTTVNVCPDYFLLFVETMNWAQISLALDPWMILVFVYG